MAPSAQEANARIPSLLILVLSAVAAILAGTQIYDKDRRDLWELQIYLFRAGTSNKNPRLVDYANWRIGVTLVCIAVRL